MNKVDPGDTRSALCAEFDAETLKLVRAAARRSPVEAVMRIRALAEVAGALDTEALLKLAVKVSCQSRPASTVFEVQLRADSH